MFYYVSQKNAGPGNGSKENPFHTIGQAADVAMPGDTVVISGGTYREWVNPKNGGLGNNQRIAYVLSLIHILRSTRLRAACRAR